MPSILFLLPEANKTINDNSVHLKFGFEQLDWDVCSDAQTSLRISNNRLRSADFDPNRFDFIWHLGFGERRTFLDRMQMLTIIDQHKLIAPVDAMLSRHGKMQLLEHQPVTHIVNEVTVALKILDDGGDWIIKPNAGSLGRDVHRFRGSPKQTSADAAKKKEQVIRLIERYGYVVVQEYVQTIEKGEKRTLLAGSELVASYSRRANKELSGSSFITNVTSGALTHLCSLTDDEHKLTQAIAKKLNQQGICFAAIDIAYPYLIETNVVNPGGIGTLTGLGVSDVSTTVAQYIADYKSSL